MAIERYMVVVRNWAGKDRYVTGHNKLALSDDVQDAAWFRYSFALLVCNEKEASNSSYRWEVLSVEFDPSNVRARSGIVVPK
jgi:hypothetical protein